MSGRARGNPGDVSLRWGWYAFGQLAVDELYALLRLRQQVFVVEQRCPYLDCDDADQPALHLLGRDEVGGLQASLRLLPPGVKFAEPSIGRVCNAAAVRGQGVGRHMMRLALAEARLRYPGLAIRIAAQRYLLGFYGSLGFEPVGEPFLEDDIPHIEMLLRPAASARSSSLG
jgi:ElaA protein